MKDEKDLFSWVFFMVTLVIFLYTLNEQLLKAGY